MTPSIATSLAYDKGLISKQSSETYFSSGFSGTIFRLSGISYLAIRGTEPLLVDPRDLFADVQIASIGIAKDQAVDLYRYWRMATTAAGAPVSYSTAEVNYLYDLQQGLLANAVAAPANASIRSTLTADRGLGVLQPGERVTVVGHSLGGHLVQAFTQMFPMSVEQAYTFNAPGFGGAFAELVDKALGPAGRLDIQTSIVSNVFAEHGPDVTAGLGIMLGGTLRIFNEQSVIPVDDHFIEKLTDSLALYDLFQRVDPNATLAAITDVLDASSNVSSRSLETALDGLRDLVAAPGSVLPTSVGDRIAFNERVLALQPEIGRLLSSGALQVDSLARMPAGTLAERAVSADGAAYRYALDRLLPYAVTGLDYASRITDHSLDLAQESGGPGMSPEWIRDRSQLLSWLSVRNVLDAGNAVRRTDGGTAVDFSWMPPSGARETLRVVVNASAPPSQVSQVYFGSGNEDVFSGSGRDDHGYGGAGADQLQGLGGNDYLEGGAGNDQLAGGDGTDTLVGGPGDDLLDGGAGENRLIGGAGFDRYVIAAGGAPNIIEDSDGLGAIVSGGTPLTGGSGKDGLFWNDAHSVYFTFAGSLDGGGLLGINGQAVVPEFHNGDLGIELAALDSVPVQPLEPAVTRHYVDSEISVEEWGLLLGQEWYLIKYPFGSPGNDIFQPGPLLGPFFAGGAGDDVIEGGFGYARLWGGSGNDLITAGTHANTAERALGYQTPAIHLIGGGAGQDQLVGGGEDDALYGDFESVHFRVAPRWIDAASFEIDGREWSVPLDGSPGRFWRIEPDFPEMIYAPYDMQFFQPPFGRDPALFVHSEIGSPSQEDLSHYYDDQLAGNEGNDYLVGGAGNDHLYGGPGDDYLNGDYPFAWEGVPGWSGLDFTAAPELAPLFGQDGDDFLDGGDGDDRIHDNGGSQSYVVAGSGDDTLDIQLGGDPSLFGTGHPSGYALLDAGPGNDIVGASSPEADIDAGEGDDLVLVLALSASVSGGDGNDTISPSGVYIDMDGGPGSDTFAIPRDTPFTYFGVGTYVVRNSGAISSDFDSLQLPFSSDDYDVWAEGDDLIFELDPLLANPGLIAPDAAVLNVTIADWFGGPQYRMDLISFPDSSEVWSPQDAEQALAGSPLVFLDAAIAEDAAFDPGAPLYQEPQDPEPPPTEIADPVVSVESPPAIVAGPAEGEGAGTAGAAPGEAAGSSSSVEAATAAAGPAAEAPHPPSPESPAASSPAAPPPAVVAGPAEGEAASAGAAPGEAAGSSSNVEAAAAAAAPAPAAPHPTSPESPGANSPAPSPPAVAARAEDSMAAFDMGQPSAANAARRLDESATGIEGAAVSSAVNELAASFFVRNQPPPLTTHQWLEQWFPAGFRGSVAERGTADPLPDASTPGTVEDPQMDWELTPEEVRLRYEEIDAFLAQDTEAADLVASAPGWPASSEWSRGFFMSADAGFGSTPGMPMIAGRAMRPLQGLSEGFAKLA